jgi:undecaprenyl-diphosphatase
MMRAPALDRLAAWDRRLCRRFNSVSRFAVARVLLAAISRLGNGVFWYTLMAALLAAGDADALAAVVHMICAGLVCTFIYKALKRGTSRPRPYAAQAGITLCAAPLDQYSFPSGHTLHAVAFTSVALAYYPALFWLLVPFTALVALSRVALGLHYPSDVLAGAAIGAGVAMSSLALLT